MGRLFLEQKKHVNQIIDNFAEAKIKATAFCDTLNTLQNELHLAKTKDEFHSIVQKIISEEKKVHVFLSELTKGADEEIMSKVMTHIVCHPHFKNIVTLLNYTEIATKNIITQKELLSLSEASVNLTEEQQTALLVFIKLLKELRPIADLLVNQKERFKEHLHHVNSLDAIDEIENEVEKKSRILASALERLLPYPQDKEVRGKIIEILKTNRHLLTILESFNLSESLMEDILHARATLVAAYDSPSLGG
jgi:hypothetical protein